MAYEHWVDVGVRQNHNDAMDLEDEQAANRFTRIIKRTEEVIE